MEKSTPVRKPHTSTADLLTWSETPPPHFQSPAAVSASRSHQPSDGISKVVFGGQVTDEEVENLLKRKPCSGYKLKEITGSGIFAANGETDISESENGNPTPNNKTGIRMYQQAVSGMSQISFADEESVSPKKPVSLPEVAKQRELYGTLESENDKMLKKQFSDVKSKELTGHDIFGPPPEITSRPLPAFSAFKASIDFGEPAPPCVLTSVKVSNGNVLFSEEPAIKTAKKINNQKFNELSGNDIFKGDAPPSAADKSLSMAKLREFNGSDIFADGKVESRDYLGGPRKPPGGDSSIALV